MTYLIANVPDPETVEERLKEQHWIDYYARFDSFQGDAEGIKYLVNFLKKRFAISEESSYYW